MSSKIVIIRHGITEGNKNKWFYGGLDLPLLTEGKEELLRQKSEGFYPEVPEHVQYFTTGMVRTEETLEVLFGEHPHRAITDLQEMSFGEYEARTFDELKDDLAFQSWTHDETGEIAFPGGETRNGFAKRVIRGTEELLNRHRLKELEVRHSGADVMSIIVCHGGVICAMMQHLFPNDKSDMWEWMMEPGSGYIVEMERTNTGSTPKSHVQIGKTMVYY